MFFVLHGPDGVLSTDGRSRLSGRGAAGREGVPLHPARVLYNPQRRGSVGADERIHRACGACTISPRFQQTACTRRCTRESAHTTAPSDFAKPYSVLAPHYDIVQRARTTAYLSPLQYGNACVMCSHVGVRCALGAVLAPVWRDAIVV